MLTTHYERNAPYAHVWNIAVNGVVVWTQLTMFAGEEIKQIVETFCRPEPTFVDVGTISEYGLTQKLSNAVRCF